MWALSCPHACEHKEDRKRERQRKRKSRRERERRGRRRKRRRKREGGRDSDRYSPSLQQPCTRSKVECQPLGDCAMNLGSTHAVALAQKGRIEPGISQRILILFMFWRMHGIWSATRTVTAGYTTCAFSFAYSCPPRDFNPDLKEVKRGADEFPKNTVPPVPAAAAAAAAGSKSRAAASEARATWVTLLSRMHFSMALCISVRVRRGMMPGTGSISAAWSKGREQARAQRCQGAPELGCGAEQKCRGMPGPKF
jgi:hypothetical protein